MGNAKRFAESQYKLQTPGVGQYNIAGFKNITKAAESSFDLGNFKSLRQSGILSEDGSKT